MLKNARTLRELLEATDRRYNLQLAAIFLCRAVKYLALLVLLVVSADVVMHLGPWGRVALVGGWVVIVAGLLLRAFYRGAVWQDSPEFTARLLESRDKSLGSALINALQLEAQASDESKPAMTRQLAQDAVGESLARVDESRLLAAVRLPEVGLNVKRAAWAACGLLVALLAAWPITRTQLPRFLDPFGDHPPYSFTQLTITEPETDGLRVTYGDEVVIKVGFSGHQPDEVYLSFADPAAPELVTTLPMFSMGDRGFVQSIEAVRSDLVVTAHTKDRRSISKQRQVAVILTPEVREAYVQVAPPAYTGLKGREKKYGFGNVRALLGSEVRFRMVSNRPLESGRIEFQGEEGWELAGALAPSGDNEASGTIQALKSGKLRFTLIDVDGIESTAVLNGSVTVSYDQAPTVSIPVPGTNSFITQDFVLEARIDGVDDYGLAQMRIHRALNGVYSPPQVIRFDEVTPRHVEVLPLTIADLGVEPGDVITISADVTDTRPEEPQFAVSEPVHLIVVSVEEYNDFLRERAEIADLEAKYDDLIDRYQELVDEQAELQKEMEALRKAMEAGEAGTPDEVQKKMDALLAKQSELNQKLKKMADEMEGFVRDKPLYDVESAFQEVLDQVAKNIREKTDENERQLERFSKESDAEKQSMSSLIESVQALESAAMAQLQGLQPDSQKMQENLVETIEDVDKINQLVRDFNRFRELYKLQEAIAEQAKTYNVMRNLSTTDKLALKKLASDQRLVSQGLEDLEKQLREHARAAEDVFPDAAASAYDFADALEKARLDKLARRGANTMLAADGPGSYEVAERLRREMEQLFNDACSKCQGTMCNSLDNYLRLLRGMNPGNTFGQMMRNRPGLAGMNGGGYGPSGAYGQGGAAAMQGGPRMNVFGNETQLGRRDKQDKSQAGKGRGLGGADHSAESAFDAVDVVEQVNDRGQRSDAVSAETALEQYGDVVNEYFEAITEDR